MDVLLPVFQLLYFIVHFLFSLAQAVYDCFFELCHLLSKLKWMKRWFEPSEAKILQDISELKKLPRHIGFIFMPKQANNYSHICKVLKWCTCCGINTISLYDIDGNIKSNFPKLLSNLRSTCTNINFKINTNNNVTSKDQEVQEFSTSINKNVFSDDSSEHCCSRNCSKMPPYCDSINHCNTMHITLNILSIIDGRENLININKNICESGIATFDACFVQNQLVTKGQIDPDVVIIIGRPTCTVGFPPWQSRLTEFVDIPSLSRLSYSEFRKQLQLFSKCQKRCGT